MRKSKHLEKHRKKNVTDNKEVTITCPKCGYKWTPNPKQWRNFNNDVLDERTLVCSRCGKKVRMPEEWVEMIWKLNA